MVDVSYLRETQPIYNIKSHNTQSGNIVIRKFCLPMFYNNLIEYWWVIILTFLKHPTKLFFEELPGNLNGSLLPPIKTLLEVSIEKEPDVIHVSL